jgi:hypothetical protein
MGACGVSNRTCLQPKCILKSPGFLLARSHHSLHFIDYMFVAAQSLWGGFCHLCYLDRGEEWLFECWVDFYLLNEYTELSKCQLASACKEVALPV